MQRETDVGGGGGAESETVRPMQSDQRGEIAFPLCRNCAKAGFRNVPKLEADM